MPRKNDRQARDTRPTARDRSRDPRERERAAKYRTQVDML